MVLRLGEQYLIRSEARAMQGFLVGNNSACTDLNVIRHRAGLENVNLIDQASVIKAIQKERQVELFSEWGHRWLDMKRIKTIDSVMNNVCPKKGGVWVPYKVLFPLPVYDIKRNPNLRGHQNPGYPEV
jgi:hypothetical protein